MLDAIFKTLNHLVGDHVIATSGTQVAEGYKPDLTLRDNHGTLTFIFESERKTDRKAFLGAVIKAEMYAEQEHAHPEFIIVMRPADNTTTKQIAEHLRPYVRWLATLKGGALNLSVVHILSDVEYRATIEAGDPPGTPEFKRRGYVIETQTT